MGPQLFGDTIPYKFKKFSVESGLSHASINHIIQDNLGCLWFATQFGLNRYDGKRFDIFLPEPNSPNSLKSWFIQYVYQDSKGRIWVGTHVKGLHRYIPESQSFEHYDIPHQGEVIVDAKVIIEDYRGMLIVGTNDRGLFFVDSTQNKLLPLHNHTPIPETLKKAKIYTIIEDDSDRLWVGTQKSGIFIWSKDRKSWKHISSLSENEHLQGDENIRFLYQDRESTIWVGTETGLFFGAEDALKFQHLEMPDFTLPQIGNIYVRSILEDSYGKLWIGTEGGLYLFHKEDSNFSAFLHDPSKSNSISNNDVISILEDHSGVLWFGLDNGGINYLDERENPFNFLGSQLYKPGHPLDVQMARSITQLRNGKFLVGTMNGGLRYCNSSYQNCEIYNQSRPGINPNFNNKIYSTWEDQNHQIWVADEDNEIFKFLPNRKKLDSYPYAPCKPVAPIADKNLGINYFDFYEDPKGGLWAVVLSKDQSPGGIYSYQPNLDSFICWREVVPYSHLLPSQNIYSLAIQGEVFWIGTTEGLYKLNSKNGTLVHFPQNLIDENELANDHIRRLHLDRNGILWVGSLHLLNTLNTLTGEWKSHLDPKGWLKGGVMAFEEDDYGNMWISTQQGILQINPDGGIVAFGIQDGLEPIHEFYMYSSFKNPSSGHIMFGGGPGFIIFHPDSIVKNSFIPPVIISKLTKYRYQKKGEFFSKKETSLIGRQTLTLSYLDKILTFEIAALNYYKSHKNLYKYKLQGFQEEWINLGNENKFTLTNLDPGDYSLLVMGSNNDGIWNEKPTQLSIKILPPWWKTFWAYLAYFFLAVTATILGVAVIRNREMEKSEQRQREFELTKLKELDIQRSEFFANISHEFRTPLTLIETPVREQLAILQRDGRIEFGMAYGRKFLTRILKNCSNLLNLVNQIMKLSQLEAGLLKLKASEQDLVSILKPIYAQFESLAETRRIEFTLQSDQEEIILYLDGEKIEIVLLNLLSNAFKFTPEGENIHIQIKVFEDQAHVSFTNTGVSIPQEDIPHIFNRFFKGNINSEDSTFGTGIGLAVVKELIELHKGSIQVECPTHKSTQFTLVLPLGNTHLKEEEIEVNQSNRLQVRSPYPYPSTPPLSENHTIQKNYGYEEALILVIEDNNSMRNLIGEILAPTYKVLYATQGLQGWERALNKVPDLIVSDIMMPKLDGIELCKRLKDDTRTSHIPVILLTAKNEETTRLDSLKSGANVFLSKPFSSEELLLRINNLLENQRKIQQFLHRKINYEVHPDNWLNSSEVLSEKDKGFVQLFIKIVEQNLDNPSFGVEELSKQIGYSRVHLFRKLKAIANITPQEFIQKIRLTHAAQLLIHGDLGISEIAYAVGFSSASHFGNRFRRLYEMTPSEFRSSKKNLPKNPQNSR